MVGDDLAKLLVLGTQTLGGDAEISDRGEQSEELFGGHAAPSVVTVPDDPRHFSAPASA